MQFFTKPWKHLIHDTFLPDSLSEKVLQLREMLGYRFGNYYSFHDELKFIDRELKQYYKKIDLFQPTLKKLFPNHRPYKQYEVYGHISYHDPKFKYPTHYEDPNKIFSFISYIFPDNGLGTTLHRSQNDGGILTVEWKTKRTLIFAGEDNVTWHSYQSGGLPRLALCCFLANRGTESSIFNDYKKRELVH